MITIASLLFYTWLLWKKATINLFASPAASNSSGIGSREDWMSYSVKEHIAECYRRAEEYKKLYHKASNLDEREIYLSTVRQFLREAKDLDRKQEARRLPPRYRGATTPSKGLDGHS
jgi:hypothetical protein